MLRAFLVTLLITLFAGALALFLLLFLDGEKEPETKQDISGIVQIEKGGIPAKTVSKEPEVLEPETAEKPVKETEPYDPGGCIRNENGRILEKKQVTEGDEATLLFAGDILFDDGYAMMGAMRQRGSIRACFSEETLWEMEQADIFMLNNEFTYTNRGTPTPEKQFTFRAKPENAALLYELGVDIVSLANNHAYDYGEVSLLDSLTTLEGIDMPYVGAGRNLAEASETVYFQAGNQKIAFISGTQIERQSSPDTKGATENTPGVFRCLDPAKLLEVVQEAKENSDFVIVYIHWGTENTAEIDWLQRDQAPKIADAGADLIIGDHPHCLQPIDYVNGIPVVYSLGNFWFNSKEVDTCLVKAVIDESGLRSLQFVPALQKGCTTTMLHDGEKERVLNYMRSISPGVNIDEEGFVTGKPKG